VAGNHPLYPQIGHYLRGHPFVVVSETIVNVIEYTNSILHCNNECTTDVHSMAVQIRSLIFIHSFK